MTCFKFLFSANRLWTWRSSLHDFSPTAQKHILTKYRKYQYPR